MLPARRSIGVERLRPSNAPCTGENGTCSAASSQLGRERRRRTGDAGCSGRRAVCSGRCAAGAAVRAGVTHAEAGAVLERVSGERLLRWRSAPAKLAVGCTGAVVMVEVIVRGGESGESEGGHMIESGDSPVRAVAGASSCLPNVSSDDGVGGTPSVSDDGGTPSSFLVLAGVSSIASRLRMRIRATTTAAMPMTAPLAVGENMGASRTHR